MIDASSSGMYEGEKKLCEVEIGDIVRLPHSDAFWPVIWTEGPITLVGNPEYIIAVRGVDRPYVGRSDQMIPCFMYRTRESSKSDHNSADTTQ